MFSIYKLWHASDLFGILKIVLKISFRFSFQWTADGLTGKTGHRVRGRVGLDRRNVCARVPNHDQPLEGKIALVSVGKPSRAKRELVQVK